MTRENSLNEISKVEKGKSLNTNLTNIPKWDQSRWDKIGTEKDGTDKRQPEGGPSSPAPQANPMH